jgi:hypothetical protein
MSSIYYTARSHPGCSFGVTCESGAISAQIVNEFAVEGRGRNPAAQSFLGALLHTALLAEWTIFRPVGPVCPPSILELAGNWRYGFCSKSR